MESSDPKVMVRLPSEAPGTDGSPRGRGALRRIAIAAGILFTLLLATTLVFAVRFRSLLDPGTLAASLEPRITRAVNRPVTIDGASLRLWPRPGVRVEGIRVANRGVFSETALASADAVILEPRLWPLLRRKVVIDRIVLRSPRVLLLVNEEGTSNFGDFIPEPDESGAGAAGSVGGISLDVQRLELIDGRAGYRDALRSRGIQLDGVNLSTDLDFAGGGIIRTEGTAEAAGVTLRLPQIPGPGIETKTVSVGWAGRVTLEPGSIELTRSEIESGAFRGRLSGRIDSLGRPVRLVDMALRAEGLSLQDLVGPTESGFLPSGAVELDLRLTGAAGPDVSPEVSGLVTVRDGKIGLENGREPITGLAADVEIGEGRAVVKADGRFLDGDLSVAGEILVDSLLPYDLRVRTEADIAGLLALAPPGREATGRTRMRGRLALDADVTGHAAGGERPLLEGTATLTDLEAGLDALTEPVRAARVPIQLAGDVASWRDVEIQVGGSRGTTTGRAANLFGTDEGRDDRPALDASVHFDHLDLDEVLPERGDQGIGWGRLVSARLGNRAIDGATAEQLAVGRGQKRPDEPPISGDLRVTIDALHYAGTRVDDVNGLIRFGRRRIEIPGLTFGAYGGSGTAALSLELGSGYVEPFGLRLDLRGVRAEEWLSRQTPLGRYVTGAMALDLELAGGLDSLLLPDAGSLLGSGTVRITDGALEPNPLSRAIASVVGAADPTGGRLDSWVSKFRIDDGTLELSDGRFDFPQGEVDLAGGVEFDGDLDLAIRLRPDPARVRELGDQHLASVPPAVREMLASSGTAELGLLVGGRIGSPTVTVDPRSVRRAQDAVIDAGRSEMEKRGLDLLRRLTGQESDSAAGPGAAVDSSGNGVGDQRR